MKIDKDMEPQMLEMVDRTFALIDQENPQVFSLLSAIEVLSLIKPAMTLPDLVEQILLQNQSALELPDYKEWRNKNEIKNKIKGEMKNGKNIRGDEKH